MLLAFSSLPAMAAEVGLVTALSGKASLLDDKAGSSELKPFVKVRRGDRLRIDDSKEGDGRARLQIVYFDGARQETWQGSGTLEVERQSAKVIRGGLQAEVKTLPEVLVKQLSKTPSAGGNVKAGMIRLRKMASVDSVDSVELVERTYADLREKMPAADRSPELYLLAGYYELRAYDKLEALLAQMAANAPGDTEVATLAALYTRAAGEAKAAEKR